MDKTIIALRKGINLKLKNPVLVVGLPGVGSVGKLVVDHLINESKAERIASLYSPHFPHYVVMTRKGGVRLVSNRFYLKRVKGSGPDIVFLTGDFQSITPEGHYIINDKIVDFFKNKLKGKFIYTIGGYNIAQTIKEKPRVFGYASNEKVAKRLKGNDILFGESSGTIMGSAGLIIAFAKEKGVDAVCLMGETTFMDVDAAGAKAVLAVLSKQLGLSTNTQNLDKMIEKTKKAVRDIERQVAGAMQQSQETSLNEKPSYIR